MSSGTPSSLGSLTSIGIRSNVFKTPKSFQSEDESFNSCSPLTPGRSLEDNTNCLKSGLLKKEGGRRKVWHSRMFRLNHDSICYYKPGNKTKKLAGTIELAPNATTVSVCNKEGKKFCFQVCTSKRIFYLCAEDENDMREWMTAIEKVTNVPEMLPDSSDGNSSPVRSEDGPLSASVTKTTPQPSPSKPGFLDQDSTEDDEISDPTGRSLRRGSIIVSVFDQKDEEHQTYLTPEDEFDIALSAAEIYLKDESELTPEEEAYIIAMRQYRAQLEDHCRLVNAKPEYSLASGTSIFVMKQEDLSQVEGEYVTDMLSMYGEEVRQQQNRQFDGSIPLELQVECAEASVKIFSKQPEDRTDEEKVYVNKVEQYLKDVIRAERQYNIKAKHSLASSSFMLAKYSEERVFEDYSYLSDLKVTTEQ